MSWLRLGKATILPNYACSASRYKLSPHLSPLHTECTLITSAEKIKKKIEVSYAKEIFPVYQGFDRRNEAEGGK